MLFADLEVVIEPGTSARPAWWPSCAQLEHFPAQTPQLVVCPALHHCRHQPHTQHLIESLCTSVTTVQGLSTGLHSWIAYMLAHTGKLDVVSSTHWKDFIQLHIRDMLSRQPFWCKKRKPK